jgi:hypothetical protein
MADSFTNPPRTSATTIGAALALIALPVAAFYALLTPLAINLPLWDDYDATLGYLLHLRALRSTSARLAFALTAQHNGYKLLFVNLLVWLQLHCLGHIDFRSAALLSNLLLLPLLPVLFALFRPAGLTLTQRLLFFAPASFLLFQLNSAETLNWATSNYQTLPVLPASLGALYLLTRGSWRALLAAVLCLLLAMAASGSGLVLVPIGAAVLLAHRRLRQLIAWLAASALFLAAYAYKFTPVVQPPNLRHALWVRFFVIKPLFFFSFLGNLAELPRHLLALPLGLALCAFWLWAIRRGFHRRNPALAACVAFIFLTALLVTWGRAEGGLWGSLSSRYRLYPTLLLIFAWFAICELLLPSHPTAPSQALAAPRPRELLLTGLATSLLFATANDIWGVHYLAQRRTEALQGMAAYEHHSPLGPVLPLPDQDPHLDTFDRDARTTLTQAIHANLYQPPQL